MLPFAKQISVKYHANFKGRRQCCKWRLLSSDILLIQMQAAAFTLTGNTRSYPDDLMLPYALLAIRRLWHLITGYVRSLSHRRYIKRWMDSHCMKSPNINKITLKSTINTKMVIFCTQHQRRIWHYTNIGEETQFNYRPSFLNVLNSVKLENVRYLPQSQFANQIWI